MLLWKKWNQNWNFEKKMNYVIIWTITVIAAAAIGISTFSFIISITDQNSRYVAEQLSIMAEDCADNLEQYKALATSIILDPHVQNYCESNTRQELYNEMGNVYSTFLNMLYIQHNANFIAVTNESMEPLFIMETMQSARVVLRRCMRRIMGRVCRQRRKAHCGLTFPIIITREENIL